MPLKVDPGNDNPATLDYRVTLPPEHELAPGGLAEGDMRKLAEATGGKFYHEENLVNLGNEVKPQYAPHTSRTEVLFWNDLSISGDNASLLRGGLLIFISGSAWAFYVVIAKPLILKYGSLPVSGLSILIATIPMLFLASYQTIATAEGMTGPQWSAMGFMVIISTFIASIAWNYGAGRLSAATAGAFLYLVPILAVGAGAIFLDEPISTSILLGGALILAGVAIAQSGERWRLARLPKR